MPRPRPTKKVSVNVANINVRGNSTNADMRITRSRREYDTENTLNNESVLILDGESPVENSDVSINIRRNVNSINNDVQIVGVEDNPSRGNNTINLDDAMINVTGNDIRNDDNSNVERGMINDRRPMQTNLNWLLILIKTSAILLKFRQEDTFVWDF